MNPLIAQGIVLGLSLAISVGPAGPAGQGLEAITKPSQDVRLSFVRAGQVATVLVKEGDRVKAGDLLMAQDDKAEQIQLLQLETQAKDDTKVKYADAQLEQKRVYLQRLQTVETTATTLTEIELARLDVTIADLSKVLAEFEHAQDRRKYEEFKAQVDRMRMTSPISGTVEMLAVQAGESAEAQTPVVRIVNTDPLWVDVPMPMEQAAQLKLGQAGRVTFEGAIPPTADGRIIYISSVAEPASGTLLVRIEVPNAAGKPAGQRVFVTFPPAAAATKSAASQPATQPSKNAQTKPQKKE